MRGRGGQKMSVFVHAQGIKYVHSEGGVKKWQNSVHVVVECPLTQDNGRMKERNKYLLEKGWL